MNPRSLAQAIRFLNVVDVVGTLFAVQVAGIEVEHNPLMRWLLAIHPVLFIFVKIPLVAVWSEFVAIFCKPEWVSRWLLSVVLVTYVIACALHTANLVRWFYHG